MQITEIISRLEKERDRRRAVLPLMQEPALIQDTEKSILALEEAAALLGRRNADEPGR